MLHARQVSPPSRLFTGGRVDRYNPALLLAGCLRVHLHVDVERAQSARHYDIASDADSRVVDPWLWQMVADSHRIFFQIHLSLSFIFEVHLHE